MFEYLFSPFSTKYSLFFSTGTIIVNLLHISMAGHLMHLMNEITFLMKWCILQYTQLQQNSLFKCAKEKKKRLQHFCRLFFIKALHKEKANPGL